MITERTIINALIIGASFILVPFIISSTLTVDYAPVLFFGGLSALVAAFFFLKDNLCICPLLATSWAGSLNFLPLPLGLAHIFCILLILYYITGYVFIRQKRIKLGLTRFLWPILIVTSILLYHNHQLHLHALGGETEGGKPAILIYLVVLAYFCGINVSTPSVRLLSKVPLYFVILAGLSSIPFLLTTYIPSLAPYLFTVTDSVNVDAYVDTLSSSGTGTAGGIGRLAAFSSVGYALQLYLLCHYPIGTWLRPERWWVLGLSLICAVFTIAAGYRSALFDFATLTVCGAWCYYSWRALVLPTGVFIGVLLLLTASNNNLIHLPTNKLPMIAQRSLSFLPGNWDEEAIESGESSNEFRKGIQEVYINEYMAKSPLIGNGFDINTKVFDALNAEMITGGGSQDPAYKQSKLFIEGKLFHTGWISVYDCVGIVGSIAFLALAWNVISVAAHFVFGPKENRRSSLFPAYVWILCNLVTSMIGFFTVFGDFKAIYMTLCIYAIALSHLCDIENTTEVPIVLPGREAPVDPSRLSGAQYGYQSRS